MTSTVPLPPGVADATWLVVPLFNEAPVIAEVVAQARRTFPHVVCVDDGSSDDSAARARAAGAIALFKDGELVHFVERHHIEGRSAEMIAENLKAAYEEFC